GSPAVRKGLRPAGSVGRPESSAGRHRRRQRQPETSAVHGGSGRETAGRGGARRAAGRGAHGRGTAGRRVGRGGVAARQRAVGSLAVTVPVVPLVVVARGTARRGR